MKKRLCALLIAMLVVLCACGKAKRSFKVVSVGGSNLTLTNLIINGELDGEDKDIVLEDAFKGYKVTNVALPDPKQLQIGGTKEGRLCYIGGVIVTIEDDSGKSLEVPIKKDDVFDVETDGDTAYLLPPQ